MGTRSPSKTTLLSSTYDPHRENAPLAKVFQSRAAS
jgi:hypothetical protein